MANIHDVAKRAGVSKSTVSLVLNHSPLVKEDTRELVEAAIEELGYVPSSNARGLRNQKTNSLGIVILTEEEGGTGYDIDQFAGLCSYNIADGIYQGLAGSRYSVATEYISLEKASKSLPKMVEDRRVDGVFVVGSFFDVDLIPRIQACGIPTVAALMLGPLIRAEGNTKQASIGMALGGLLNIGLDAVFVPVLGLGAGGAGIATCNEIATTGTPCILIPSPNVTGNHQEKNARVLEAAGGSVVILEKDCTPEVLYAEVQGLLVDEQRREQMSKALRGLVKIDSAERICDIVEELAKN